MKELREKVAVVTGAASGFGREFAIRCADEGMKVVLTDIDEGGLATTVARPVDLRPRLADNNCCSIYRRTSATEPKTPRGIVPQSAKSLLFNNIDRWVF